MGVLITTEDLAHSRPEYPVKDLGLIALMALSQLFQACADWPLLSNSNDFLTTAFVYASTMNC